MRKIILYIAQSLDGYVSRENLSIDWLPNVPQSDEITKMYTTFQIL